MKKKKSDRHLLDTISLRLPPDMLRVLDRFAASNDRKRTGEITRALREYLERAGLWPPQSDTV